MILWGIIMRKISVADYFVEFLIANEITDVFGYQGGMIAYIFDSLGKYKDKINYHSCGNEQGAALAACAYAQAAGKMGVAISTSGPGFTNLLTGMANAWFDSIPVLFVSGNVNTKDKKRANTFRQNGFQEIQAADMARPITKKAVEIELDTDIIACLDDAIQTAMADRRGPVYLDLPINICREMVSFDEIQPYVNPVPKGIDVEPIITELVGYDRPVMIAGAGIHQAECEREFRELVELLGIPVVTTMPGVDLLQSNNSYMMGYIGGTARREAGIVLQNADAVISLGTRLCSKQVGHNMALFAPRAKRFIRLDIDESEFERRLRVDEEDIHANLRSFVKDSVEYLKSMHYQKRHQEWSKCCEEVCSLLSDCDMTVGNTLIQDITALLPDKANVVLDVGKNLTYGTQSAVVKDETRLFMSAGLGTMGYSIPAAIGAVYGNHLPTFAFTGDGGAQMNIQELITIAKNELPIKIFVFNNKALGNIRIFQENYLGSRYIATTESEGDYFSCNFAEIAKAYGITSFRLTSNDNLNDYRDYLNKDKPVLFEIMYEDCSTLPGIVAGGNFLGEDTGLENTIIEQIKRIIEYGVE